MWALPTACRAHPWAIRTHPRSQKQDFPLDSAPKVPRRHPKQHTAHEEGLQLSKLSQQSTRPPTQHRDRVPSGDSRGDAAPHCPQPQRPSLGAISRGQPEAAEWRSATCWGQVTPLGPSLQCPTAAHADPHHVSPTGAPPAVLTVLPRGASRGGSSSGGCGAMGPSSILLVKEKGRASV